MAEITDAFDLTDPLDPADSAFAVQYKQDAREAAVDEAQRILRDRRDAYMRVFNGGSSEGDRLLVMKDLTRFCRGNDTPWADEPRLHALLTGRQEVYRRIQDHMYLNFDDLWEKYSKVPT